MDVTDKEMKRFIQGRQNDNISMWHFVLKETIIEEEKKQKKTLVM